MDMNYKEVLKMKKIMVIILLGLTCLTMYFVVLWEPSVDVGADNEAVEEEKIEKKEKEKVEKENKEKSQNEKEKNKNKEQEEKRHQEELKEKENEEREENKKNFLDFRKKLNEEDKKIIDKKMGTLSTMDLMKVEEFLNLGEIKKAMDLMKLRMLEADWKCISEVLGKYKQ